MRPVVTSEGIVNAILAVAEARVRSDLPSCAVVSFFKQWVFNYVTFTLFIVLNCLNAILDTIWSAEQIPLIVIVVAVVEVKVRDLLAIQSGEISLVAGIKAFQSEVIKINERYLLLHYS